MKTLKYILIFILSVGLFNSCLFEETAQELDLNGQGPNLGGFELARTNFAAIADGEEYQFDLKMKVFGPTWTDITNPVTLTIGVDPSSTVVEGTHFRIDNPTITLSPDNNMLGLFRVTMLTEGIETPLPKSPVLVLTVTEASGDPNVLNSGKPINITFNYACPSFLEGTYNVTMIRDGGAPVTYTDVITKTGIGEYRTSEVGHWIGGLGVGTPGYTFIDVCGVLTVPGQNLVDYYSNWVEGTEYGSVDPETGVLHIVYSISSSAWTSVYDCTYVPVN